MRLTVVFILFLTLGFQLVAKLGVVALYQVNKDYIAKNLCENRAKPKMHCDGKCYLKKQLKKVEDTEDSNNPTSKSESLQLIVFIIPALGQPGFLFDDVRSIHHYSQYRSINGISALKNIFHPPQQFC